MGAALGAELHGQLLRVPGAVPRRPDEIASLDEFPHAVRLWDVSGALHLRFVVAAPTAGSTDSREPQVPLRISWYDVPELGDCAGGTANS